MRKRFRGRILWITVFAAAAGLCLHSVQGQNTTEQRAFPQSKAAIDKILQRLQPAMSGRLPALEGFAMGGDHPLASYSRGFYQLTVQVTAAEAGGSVVHVTSKVTAWFTDHSGVHSGYQLLASNGRLEADFLDQLADQLATASVTASAAHDSKAHQQPSAKNQIAPSASDGEPSAPVPRLPEIKRTLTPPLSPGVAHSSESASKPSDRGEAHTALREEAANLEEVLKNQAHPNNLVAVKKSATPVVSSPSLTSKTLLLASIHDEFEMLGINHDWVHVRISGLSRGWIWRNSVELPDSVPDSDIPSGAGPPLASDLFHVSREESAPFPGDWEPLRGKTVKIISVEKIVDVDKDSGPQSKLEFAKSILDQEYKELAQKKDTLAGIVVIFDSSDGGMLAVTFSVLQQWKGGRLSDAALWHQSFFDPPETFVPSGSQGGK